MLDHGNSEYWTGYNGEFTHVYKLDEAVRAILCRNKNDEEEIKSLREENKKLKEENWKDKELQDMKERLEKMQNDYWRGFPITEEEENAIREWQKKHEAEAHGLTTRAMRMKAGGVSGGRYSYKFLPTSIGCSGVVRCSCGAEFEFQEIG